MLAGSPSRPGKNIREYWYARFTGLSDVSETILGHDHWSCCRPARGIYASCNSQFAIANVLRGRGFVTCQREDDAAKPCQHEEASGPYHASVWPWPKEAVANFEVEGLALDGIHLGHQGVASLLKP